MKIFQKIVFVYFEYIFYKFIWRENQVLFLKDKFGYELNLELNLFFYLKSVLKYVLRGNGFN